jgi:hypothetical protein
MVVLILSDPSISGERPQVLVLVSTAMSSARALQSRDA